MSAGWQRGLDRLARARSQIAPEGRPAFDDLERVAQAAYCHFRSTYLQVRYVRARDGMQPGAGRAAALRTIVREEIILARRLHGLILRDSRIGIEAANHYSSTVNDLKEKVIQCEWLRRHLALIRKGQI